MYLVACFILVVLFHCLLLCCFVCGTCVRGHAQRGTPPRGCHSECIITINEKVNGAFSYISIYIWLFGRTNDVWAVATNAIRHQNRGLMCFCGHQMLWIMMRPLNANQMLLDRLWSTVPAWKLSPTDTIKKRKWRDLPSGRQNIALLRYTFQIWCKAIFTILHERSTQKCKTSR